MTLGRSPHGPHIVQPVASTSFPIPQLPSEYPTMTETLTRIVQPPEPLASPFPWFGGKHAVAAEVWTRFGNVSNYVEPFAGSLAVLLGRPAGHRWWMLNESVNDLDGNIANWHRAVAADPNTVAFYASQPVNELDLTARHLWLVQHGEQMREDLARDPDFYDARAAGWWVWGISAWVGGEWCSGIGPYTGTEEPSITRGGSAPGVYRKLPMMAGAHGGKGIHKPINPHGLVPGTTDESVADIEGSYAASLATTFTALSNRLRRVRVACGDWSRVLVNVAQPADGHVTGVFLDPPYDPAERRTALYSVGDHKTIRKVKEPATQPDTLDLDVDALPRLLDAHEAARQWALDRTDDPTYRIAYCSYSTEAEDQMFLDAGWVSYRWSAAGGYSNSSAKTQPTRAKDNRHREVVWFSPSCIVPEDPQLGLFE